MIYYVEDDINIRELTLYALRKSGLVAQGFDSAESFRCACQTKTPNLILLDLMLPEEDGISLLAWIKSTPELSSIPVMILSAKGTEFDKVCGLDAGADDYLAKPYGMMELVSRCNALTRRSTRTAQPEQDIYQIGCLTLYAKAHEVRVAGNIVVLARKEFSLLRKFMQSPGQTFTRAQLLQDIWHTDFIGETRTIDTHVQTLRHKLNEAGHDAGDLIQTVRGVGYRIRKEVSG